MSEENSTNKQKAIVLLSGGMDSCVTAAAANEKYELIFLHAKYKQRTEKRELKAFNDIADYYGVKKRIIIDLGFLKDVGGSSLTDENIDVEKSNLEISGIPSTYVPFRNANILSQAVSWAEVLKAGAIFIGAVEQDSAGYPDCRKVFYDAFNNVVKLGTKPETNIEIITPLIDLKKSEIVKLGLKLNAPLHLSWSCYTNEVKACGECSSCMLRLNAFKEAGIEDLIEYVKM